MNTIVRTIVIERDDKEAAKKLMRFALGVRGSLVQLRDNYLRELSYLQ